MNFLENIINFEDNINISGLTFELNIFYVLEKFKKIKKNILVVTNSLYEANQIYNRLSTYTEDVLLFPMDDFLTSVALAVSPDLKVKRLETLEQITSGNKKIVITNLMGYLKFLPNQDETKKYLSKIKVGDKIKREEIISTLADLGYKKDSLVTTTGEYAVRGYIIDVFLLEEEHPFRIEMFGDEIESIRYFNEETQISIAKKTEINLRPFAEIKTKSNSSLYDYLKSPLVIFYNMDQIKAGYEKLEKDMFEYKLSTNVESNYKYMYELNEINPEQINYISTFNNKIAKIKTYNYETQDITNFNSDFAKLKDFVLGMKSQKKKIIFFLSRKEQIWKINELLEENIKTIQNITEAKPGTISVIKKKINKGFRILDYIVISEFDIENISHKKINYKNTYKLGSKINSFNDIKKGDYVVHAAHGIGIYNGVVTLNKNGIQKDYLQINYKDNDKIYIPVEKINTIYKYANKEDDHPKINKLNSVAWQKTKQTLKRKVKDISAELMRLYAERKKIKKDKYYDFPEESIFASEFTYEETKDQLKAIHNVNDDLRSENPMDRLLCGDVGYGKTEVALRGMFKTILNGYQVLYLCPTTILSKQQYNTALERFKNFGVNIGLLNRFTPKKEQTRILNALQDGTIDLVFGTHRLLSDDVVCKKLGLLVVDEEQRFGVTHKEKIKTLKKDVNVLTLSATPIPRTLKLALSGLRDLSIIDTPPVNRYPIQTYVVAEEDVLIQDAIYKELSRGGQVFMLYNRVENIESQVEKIKQLVPEARINYAHGQMKKEQLEDIMDSFINYEFDVLVCTTIIETGIDIPNANTLIIIDADRFGLAQLYQIRGRVGRSDKIAYAYFMYNKGKVLNDDAVKRLQAIKEFTELGSGYKIAMRDLAIRGAGDILGSEQAGFVDTVGIDLFMKMIEEEIASLNGEAKPEEPESAKALIEVDTHISDHYVSDEEIKIEIHKKINEIDSLSKLKEVKTELEDRFGKIPETMEIYMYEEWFEKLALSLKVVKVMQNAKEIEIEIPEDVSNKLAGDKLFLTVYNINPKFSLRYAAKKIYVKLPIKGLEKHFIYYLINLLEYIRNEVNV